jgi:hypothetical protein
LVLRPKLRNRRSDFKTEIIKPELSVLRPKPRNPPPPWFWGSTKKPTAGFEAKTGETIATSFEAKLEKTVTIGFEVKPEITVTGFEAKPLETVVTGFEAKLPETIATGFKTKPVKTVWVVWGQTTHKPLPSVLRPRPMRNRPSGFEVKPLTNHWPWFWGSTKKSALIISTCMVQTAHGATWLFERPTIEYPTCVTIPILSIRSPTPATILVAARHVAPATCTPRDKQTRFSNRNRDKLKTKQNNPGFKFKPRQVNDSSQSNQGTDHLDSQILIHFNHEPVGYKSPNLASGTYHLTSTGVLSAKHSTTNGLPPR